MAPTARAGARPPLEGAQLPARAPCRAGPSAIDSPRPGPSSREAAHAAPARPQAAALRRRWPCARARAQTGAPAARRPLLAPGEAATPFRAAGGRRSPTWASRASAPSAATPPRATLKEPAGPRKHTKLRSPDARVEGPSAGPAFTAPTRAASAAARAPAAAARAQANAASAAWLHGSAALRAMPRTSNRRPGTREGPVEPALPRSTPNGCGEIHSRRIAQVAPRQRELPAPAACPQPPASDSLRTAWAFVPWNANALVPQAASRASAPAGRPAGALATCMRAAVRPSAPSRELPARTPPMRGLQLRMCCTGRDAACSICSPDCSRPARPAAASEWPTMAFTAVTDTTPSGPAPRPCSTTCAAAPISMGSPSAVPVPCSCRPATQPARVLASPRAAAMTACWAGPLGAVRELALPSWFAAVPPTSSAPALRAAAERSAPWSPALSRSTRHSHASPRT